MDQTVLENTTTEEIISAELLDRNHDLDYKLKVCHLGRAWKGRQGREHHHRHRREHTPRR